MTVSFNGLGREGRLGNQMFQYAFIRGVAANRGFDWTIPGPNVSRPDNYGLFEAFKLTNCDLEKNTGELPYRTIEYRDMHFNEDIFERCNDNTNFSGNFQTERYFENIADSIREDFTFTDNYLDPCKEFIESLGGGDNCIFLHVRRGNPNLTGRRGEKWSYQMVQEYHPLCKEDYYTKALKEFPEDVNVIVVSDLIDWCKRQSWLQGDRFHFSDSSFVNFLKNNRLGFTIAPEATKTSCGIEVISIILALLSTKSRIFCKLVLFRTPSGKTIPILPPGFNNLRHRSINKTSVSVLIEPVSYRLNKYFPMLLFICSKALS